LQGNIQIEPRHENTVLDILRQFLTPQITVWVFGSRAKHNAKPYSDLDLALESSDNTKIDINLIIKLETAFEESDLPWKVDIIDMNDISETFRDIVIKNRCLLNL
jgi:predicted nucleotidyltransferase